MGLTDYEQEGMLMNHFLVIILSELLHEAQRQIIKMGLAEKIAGATYKVCRYF